MRDRSKRDRSRGSSGNNRKLAEEFLAKNGKKKGIVETGTGLQYQVIEHGEGASPAENSYLTVHQRCTLVSGQVIEDTYKENKPSEVQVNELIEGYQEGIMLMNKGARYRFYIHPDLAWGKKGSGSKIPPNSLLIFDVRLIDFW